MESFYYSSCCYEAVSCPNTLKSDRLAFTLQVFDLLKSRFESPQFLQEFHEIQKSVCQNGAGMPLLNALVTLLVITAGSA